MIPADILTAIAIVFIGFPVAWFVLLWIGEGIDAARTRLMLAALERTRATVGNDCGDQGGHPQPVEPRQSRPKAPETGSGLLVRKDEWEKGGRAEFFRASRSARADRPQDF